MKMFLSREGNIVALFVSACLVFATFFFAGSASAVGSLYVDPSGNDGGACTASGASACQTIQGAIGKAIAGDTINVAAGTYTGNLIIPVNNLSIIGTGVVTLNLAGGYGIDITGKSGFTLDGLIVNASTTTTWALKASEADNITVKNSTFNGDGDITVKDGGVDFITSNNVIIDNVISNGFKKNGFSFTTRYTTAQTGANNISFNNITASNNGWAGVALYTVGQDKSTAVTPSTGGSSSITGVYFTGANVVSGNPKGIQVQGDSDAKALAGTLPAYTVTGDGTTLDLTSIAFSGNTVFDIVNYQTAPVNAIGATFGGKTGDAMTAGERTAQDVKIHDKLDNANLGLVTYYSPSLYKVTIYKYIDGQQATTGGPFSIHEIWNTTNIGAGNGDYNIEPNYQKDTALMNAGADYSFSENFNDKVSAVCDGSAPYALDGYTYGNDLATVQNYANLTQTAPNWTDLQANQYAIVWNKTCVIAPNQYTVTTYKYIDDNFAGDDLVNNTTVFTAYQEWDADNLDYLGFNNNEYTLNPTNGDNNPGNPYTAKTAPLDAGSSYKSNEILNDNVGATCAEGKPYALEGYTYGNNLPTVQDKGNITTIAPDWTNLQENKYVIVWNEKCVVAPNQYTVTIKKYLGLVPATEGTFAMQSTWTAANLSGGVQASGNYTLETGNGYTATTSLMDAGADYTTEEVPSADVGATCAEGKTYALVGYSVGTDEATAALAAKSTTVPSFTGLNADQYVIVWNEKCEVGPNYCEEVDTLKDQIKDLKKEYKKDIRQAVKDNTKWVKKGRWGGYWQFDRRGYAQDLRDLTDEYKEALHDLVNALEEAEANCSGDYEGYKWGKQHHKYGVPFDKKGGKKDKDHEKNHHHHDDK